MKIIFLFLTVLIFKISTTSVAEIDALEDLYYSTNGYNWHNNTNWFIGDPCLNNWYGVNCLNNHVSELFLDNNNLNGILQASISNLYQLEVLFLMQNNISSSIPRNITDLRMLAKLDLSNNSLTDIIPDQIGNMVYYSLDYLNLGNNKLVGTVPTSLYGKQNYFIYIDLSDNNFFCPISVNVLYTKATCYNWSVITTNNNCYMPYQRATILGEFIPINGVQCIINNLTTTLTNNTWKSDAIIINNNELLCDLKMNWNYCDNNTSYYNEFNLSLSYLNTSIPNTSIKIRILNDKCIYGNMTTIIPINTATNNKYNQLLFTFEQAIEICYVGLSSRKWMCPRSITNINSYIYPHYVDNCVNGINTTCNYGQNIILSSNPSKTSFCFFQCNTYDRICYPITSSCTASSGTKSTCYSDYNECMLNC